MARDEMLDLLPESTFFATLIMDGEKVACQIIEEMNAAIIVAVPGVDRYEGNSRLTLRMNRTTMPVRLVLQERRLDGYLFQLYPINDVAPRSASKANWLTFAARFCGAGAMAVIAVALVYVPTHGSGLNVQQLAQKLTGWSSGSHKSVNTAPVVSINESLALKELLPQRRAESREGSSVSISMISSASRSSAENGPKIDRVRGSDGANNASTPAGAQRVVSLKSLLKAGQAGRVQVLTAELAPWLYSGRQNAHSLAIRVSDAACGDLSQFAAGLQGLSASESSGAVSRLRETLVMVEQSVPDAKLVEGTTDVFVVTSTDARVYFRLVNGKTELIRILPIDFNEVDRL